MYQKILVPLDGSKFSECSLEHVKAIANGCRVPKVVLLRIVEPVHHDYRTGFVSEDMLRNAHKKLTTAANNYLTKVADNLKKEVMAVDTVTSEGAPAEKILDYTNKNKVDLIIMSTHGRSGVSRWAIGSVADRVLRHPIAPVLVISPEGCRKQPRI